MTDVIAAIPRHLLPQIPKEKLPEFVRYLDKEGIRVQKEDVPAKKLLPIQKHVNKEKVKSIIQDKDKALKIPLIVTSDGYLVDGHHRWLAALVLQKETVNCLICECSLKDFLRIAHDFDHSYVKSVHEVTTYYSRLI
jgi:hypothetical protein